MKPIAGVMGAGNGGFKNWDKMIKSKPERDTRGSQSMLRDYREREGKPAGPTLGRRE